MNPEVAELRVGLDNLLDDRDYLFRLLDSIDWDAQLDAIRSVLARNRSAAERVAANIDELGQRAETYSGPHHHHVVDEHVDAMWRSSYSDAAVSLSAIGMIVPMVESVFSQSDKHESLERRLVRERIERAWRPTAEEHRA